MNCENCGEKLPKIGLNCSHCGKEIDKPNYKPETGGALGGTKKLIPKGELRKISEQQEQAIRKRIIVARNRRNKYILTPIYFFLFAGAIGLEIHYVREAIDGGDKELAKTALPIILMAFMAFCMKVMFGITRPMNDKEYYSITGSRTLEGGHRCIWCGRGGVNRFRHRNSNEETARCRHCDRKLFVARNI